MAWPETNITKFYYICLRFLQYFLVTRFDERINCFRNKPQFTWYTVVIVIQSPFTRYRLIKPSSLMDWYALDDCDLISKARFIKRGCHLIADLDFKLLYFCCSSQKMQWKELGSGYILLIFEEASLTSSSSSSLPFNFHCSQFIPAIFCAVFYSPHEGCYLPISAVMLFLPVLFSLLNLV